MNKSGLRYVAILAVAAASVLTSGVANAITIATFADPTVGGPIVSMFDVRDTGAGVGRVKGKTGGTILDLQVDNTIYTDAILEFGDIAYTGNYKNGTLKAGEFNFFYKDSNNNPVLVLKVQFESGKVNVLGLGGENIFSDDGVRFSGPAVDSLGTLTEESFSFSFANQKPIKNGTTTIGFTSTAAFASSAVPEPATIFLLTLGSVLVATHRRRRR